MLDGCASSSSPAFLACMFQMPITFFPLVPTPQNAITDKYIFRLQINESELMEIELERIDDNLK
jgi:hypothetical protein